MYIPCIFFSQNESNSFYFFDFHDTMISNLGMYSINPKKVYELKKYFLIFKAGGKDYEATKKGFSVFLYDVSVYQSFHKGRLR